MSHRYTRHALERIRERRIPQEWIAAVLTGVAVQIPGYAGRVVYQGRFERDGRPMLLRVVVEGNLVITALLTSKIDKYGG